MISCDFCNFQKHLFYRASPGDCFCTKFIAFSFQFDHVLMRKLYARLGNWISKHTEVTAWNTVISISSLVWRFCRNIVSGESPKTLQKLCVSTKFPHQEIRWSFGILRSECVKYHKPISKMFRFSFASFSFIVIVKGFFGKWFYLYGGLFHRYIWPLV